MTNGEWLNIFFCSSQGFRLLESYLTLIFLKGHVILVILQTFHNNAWHVVPNFVIPLELLGKGSSSYFFWTGTLPLPQQ